VERSVTFLGTVHCQLDACAMVGTAN